MSNASHAKEPSMEEILASIRRIIESGDERPSLPGLSLTPRAKRREAPAEPEPLPAAANREGEPTAGGAGATSRGAPLALSEEPAPLRIFQPANAALADPDPFEDLATWVFSPADARAEPEMPDLPAHGMETGYDATTAFGDIAGEAGKVAAGEAATPAAPGPSRNTSADLGEPATVRPPEPSPSLADAYGASRILPPSLRADVRPAAAGSSSQSVATESASEDPATGAVATPGYQQEPSALDAGTPILLVDVAGSDSVTATSEPVPPSFPQTDFSDEFDEDAFTEALRGAVVSGSFEPDIVVVSATEAEVEPEAVETPSLATLSTVMSETSTLMSVEAGSQVAAAFDDLARAIRDGQMKSMEEMAREMLRPMLQEWLDDNLPRLVEKLVREEIERVARGGRR